MRAIDDIGPTPNTLYVAKSGNTIAAWWEPPPPLTKDGKCPKFKAPALWHDQATGEPEDIIRHFANAGLIKNAYRVQIVMQEWAKKGLELGMAVKAKARRKAAKAITAPMFSGEWLAPVNAFPEREALLVKYTVAKA